MTLVLQKREVELKAEIQLPLSKSLSNRLLVIKSLCSTISQRDVAKCDDSQVLFEALEYGIGTINVGHAGTPFRFLLAYYTYQGLPIILDGSSRMRERPIEEMVTALNTLGADLEYLGETGYPPIAIRSGIKGGGEVSIDLSRSSQFASALLLIGPYLQGGLKINYQNLVSESYLSMTVEMMKHFGVDVLWSNSSLEVKQGKYTETPFELESDWSAASYFYCILSLSQNGALSMNGLRPESLQGDKVVVDLFSKLGVVTRYNEDQLTIKREGKKSEIDVDLNSTPDIVPSVLVACCGTPGVHKIRGINHLQYKESDRISILTDHFSQLNVSLEVSDNDVIIDTRNFQSNVNFVVNAANDHRMAMSLACLVMLNGNLKIENEEVVEKSFPEFWNEMSHLLEIEHA